MRILVALRDSKAAADIAANYRSFGNVVHIANDPVDAAEIIKTTQVGYNLLVCDGNIRFASFGKKSPATLLIDRVDTAFFTKNPFRKQKPDFIFDPAIGYLALCRQFNTSARKPVLTFVTKGGSLTLDIYTKELTIDGIAIKLTDTSYKIIETLCLARGLFLSDDALMEYLYDEELQPGRDIANVKMQRKNLQDSIQKSGFDPNLIIDRKVHLGTRLFSEPDNCIEYKIGNVIFNASLYKLKGGKQVVDLAFMEGKILKYLLENKNRSRSHEQIQQATGAASVDDLKTLISGIRKKLTLFAEESFIQTTHFGYRINSIAASHNNALSPAR